ncbi:sugar transferase [Butyrivibrio sp. WCD3002]|uniref:sugar transferase n=1 Tax=Butyrivibrio sp. WCD3002 TaxID=1280676 RepID=UPI00040108E4|nr:sugar transferase [Butyrivibrio sp. WCD3002]
MNVKKKAMEGKYLYRAVCCTILTIIDAALFVRVWYNFVKINNTTGQLTGLGNLGMALGIYVVLTIVMFKGVGGYKIGVNRKTNILASQVVAIFSVNFLEVFISMAITGQFRFFFDFLLVYLMLGGIQSIIVCFVSVPMINSYRTLFPPMTLLEIGGENENDLLMKIAGRPDKYEITGKIHYDITEEELRKKLSNYDAVLINDIPSKPKNDIIKICFDMDKRVYFTPKLSDIIVKSSDALNLFDTPLYFCRNIGMPLWQRILKRVMDVLLSAIALIVASPVMLVVALLIHKEDGGPVFFKQERCTLGGEKFMILKFRSMIVDAEKDGKPRPAGEDDDRITKVGHFIRATRIDELPQLINILKGEMSIVGPRPERVEHVEKYCEDIPEFAFRQKVKGGLTGYAQVYGKYNTSALDKLKLDMIYIVNYSFLMDVQIIFETIKVIFRKESTEGFTQEQQNEMRSAVSGKEIRSPERM